MNLEQPLAATLRSITRAPALTRLTLREFALLTTLDELRLAGEAGPHSTMDLAAMLGIGKPVITRATTALVIHGLISRQAHPKDKRKVSIKLTEKGIKTLAGLGGSIALAA